MSLTHFIQNHLDLSAAEHIIFYGGSFNPWHEGHSACLELAPKNIPIIVIPDHNPHKELDESRFLNIDDLSKTLSTIATRTIIFDEFFYAKRPNPTIDWIKVLTENFPNKKFSLLLGNDSFVRLLTWKDSHQLLNLLYELFIVSRNDNQELTQKMQEQYLSINPKLKITYLGHHLYEDLASSHFRK